MDFLQSMFCVCCFHFLCLFWCCVIVVCLAAMKPGRGQQTSLWEGSVKDLNLTAPTWGQRSTPPSWFSDDEALYWVNGVEENPVWNLISLPLPKLRNLGAQPCQPGGGIKVTHHPQPWGEGFEGWTNSHHRAAIGGHTGRERHSLANRKLASTFICWSVRQRETNSSITLIWLRLLCRFSSFGHAHFLPQTGNGRSTWWLNRDSEPSFSASYLAVPHSSLSPSSLVTPPSVSLHRWVFAFSALGRWACRTGQQRRRVEGRTGVTDWKENRLWAWIYRGSVRQSTSLPSPRPSSSSQRGILLDLLPHTLSTDHAHYVFNSSILCKTG